MEQSGLPKKVLVIDDDRSISKGLQNQLLKYGVNVQTASDLDSAFYLFNTQSFDVVIVELEFEPLTGLAIVQKMRQNKQGGRDHTGIIIAAGQSRTTQDAMLLRELGDLEFIDKPIQIIKLLPFLSRALDRKLKAASFETVREIAYKTFQHHKSADQAIAKLELQAHQDDPPRVQLACEFLEQEGRMQDAIKIVDALLAKRPNDTNFLSYKASLLLKTGHADEARKLLEMADKLAPKNLDRIQALAKLYLENKQPDQSVEKMREIIKLNPDLKDLKFDLFADLDKAGFQEHAVKLCKETTPPKEVIRYYNNKGVMSSKEGHIDEALREYYTALIYYPKFKDNFRILFNIALAEISKKTPEAYAAAVSALEKCLALSPDFEKARKLLTIVQDALTKGAKKTA